MVKKRASKSAKPSVTAGATRRRKPTKKQARTIAKIETRALPATPNSFQLIAQVLGIWKRFWKPLAGLLVVYLILNILFASGISSLNSTVNSIKSDLNNTGLNAHPLVSGAAGFLVLVSSAGSSSSASGSILQVILIVLQSLVIIWALRQLMAGKSIGIKQAYYSSMAPLIPFLLIILVIFIQFLPITFGSTILAAITSALGNISGFWTFLFGLIFVLLSAWSFYMISSSIFALYIVTLPEIQPRAALASARNLVRFRRWLVVRRVLFLPIFLLVVSGLIVIPLTLYATFLVAPIFYVLSALSLLFAHSYLYSLYRGLLG